MLCCRTKSVLTAFFNRDSQTFNYLAFHNCVSAYKADTAKRNFQDFDITQLFILERARFYISLLQKYTSLQKLLCKTYRCFLLAESSLSRYTQQNLLLKCPKNLYSCTVSINARDVYGRSAVSLRIKS